MSLPDSFIYDLVQNNPIDGVMSSYVNLMKRGRDYVCLCPFHSEKTASCHVYMSDMHFHCFGCHASGNVITFIMKIENLSYIEAVRFLADRAGMQMPDEANNNELYRVKTRILEINRTAARFYYDILTNSPDGEKGRRYFAERSLESSTITKYGLGYAPGEWSKLYNFLRSKGYTDEELVLSNLCMRGKNNSVYDSFRDRVMFPIIDVRGNVIAFGGRIIDGTGPKYLNSSDTPVFKKSRNLFSLNFAKKSEEKKLILAEGYMDVISINQAGFENVVATLGTALTPEQARLMKQHADEIIIAYDSDGAGQTATHKAINLLSEAGLETRIIKMEGAKDPDEFIKKFGAARFRQLIDHSDGAISFEMSKCAAGIDLGTEEGKLTYLNRVTELMAKIDSPIAREVYISKVASELNINKNVIVEQVESIISKKEKAAKKAERIEIERFGKQRKENPEAMAHLKEYRAEEGIIAYTALNPENVDYVLSKINPECFVTEFNKKVFEKIVERIHNSTDFDIMLLQSEFTADEMSRINNIIFNNRSLNISSAALDDYINVLAGYKEKAANVGDLADDDFSSFFENLKRNK